MKSKAERIAILNDNQRRFFERLAWIQEDAVELAPVRYRTDSVEELLNEVTYDVLCEVMELIDGYTDSELQLDLVDRRTGARLKECPHIELHDCLADFLKY